MSVYLSLSRHQSLSLHRRDGSSSGPGLSFTNLLPLSICQGLMIQRHPIGHIPRWGKQKQKRNLTLFNNSCLTLYSNFSSAFQLRPYLFCSVFLSAMHSVYEAHSANLYSQSWHYPHCITTYRCNREHNGTVHPVGHLNMQ